MVVLNNQVARDFDSLERETQKLVLATCGQKVDALEEHLAHLAQNLRRSDLIIWAAERIRKQEPLAINWEDLLTDIIETCLKTFHQESYLLLRRMQMLMKRQLEFLEDRRISEIDDFGYSEFHSMRHYELSAHEKDSLVWAALFHDLCRLCYELDFWTTPGAFPQEKRKLLDYHVRDFYFLGEMLNVSPLVTALAVLHHYPNKGYPSNGIITKLRSFLTNPRFRYMLNWLISNIVYVGATNPRSYRKDWGDELVLSDIMPQELRPIGMGFAPFILAIKQPGENVACPTY